MAAIAALLGACAGAALRATRHELVVTEEGRGAELWRGPASYVLRPPARVVGLPGLGELQVSDAGCRFVWSREGLDHLAVLPAAGECAQVEARRLCFSKARFSTVGSAVVVEGAPRALVVDGCADENDLLESRLGAAREATVGPVDWRRRCAPLPARRRGCEVSWLALGAIEHEANADPAAGFSFTWDGDRFGACFLERDAGRYRMELSVEDTCGDAEQVTLSGHSAELD